MASDQFGPPYKTAQSQSAQLCRLLVDCGCHALRVTFDNIHPPEELYSVLSSGSVQATLKSLFKRKILSPAQWEMLYPVIPSFVSSANFDATLLMVLLRSICHLRSPANGWDNFPSSTDRNIEDDIARIRWYRNAWAHQTSLDCDTFDKYWQDIRGILMRLGLASYGTAIDELRSSRMDPDIEEYYQDTLSQWQREEDDLKKLWQMDVEVHNLVEEIHHGGNCSKRRRHTILIIFSHGIYDVLRLSIAMPYDFRVWTPSCTGWLAGWLAVWHKWPLSHVNFF